MKRPKDIEIMFFNQSLAPAGKLEIEYPSSGNICGPGGDQDCNYPQTPTSSYTLQVCDAFEVLGQSFLCQPVSLVQVTIKTPRNNGGQIIVQEVALALEGQTTTPAPSGNVLLEMTNAGVNCGEVPNLESQTMVHLVNLSSINVPRSSNNNPKIFGYQTGNNWVARFTAALSVCVGGWYDLSLSLGSADTAALIIDGVEVARSGCSWSFPITATVELDSGLHTLQVIYGDDGWTDEVVLSYKGPDSCMSWMVVPPSVFLPSGEIDVRCYFTSDCPTSTSTTREIDVPAISTSSVSIINETENSMQVSTTVMTDYASTTRKYTTAATSERIANTTVAKFAPTTKAFTQYSTARASQQTSTVSIHQTTTAKALTRTTMIRGQSTTWSILPGNSTTTTTVWVAPQTTRLAAVTYTTRTAVTIQSSDFLGKGQQATVMGSNSELKEAEYVEMHLVVKNIDYAKLMADQAVHEEFDFQIRQAIASESGPTVTSNDIALELSPGSVVVSASISLPESPDMVAHLAEVRDVLSSSSNLPQMVAEHIRSMERVDTIASGDVAVSRGTVSIKSKLLAVVKDPSVITNTSTTQAPSSWETHEDISGAQEMSGLHLGLWGMLASLLTLSAPW
jgi:hypothetical protein